MDRRAGEEETAMKRWTDSGEAQLYLSFTEEVGEVLHGIAANAGDVLVFLWLGGLQRLDTIPDVIGHFDSDLKAQHELVWEERRQLHWTEVETKGRRERGSTRQTAEHPCKKNPPRAPKRPPYPQPMSANSTCWLFCSEGSPGKKRGYSSDQSISSGQTGLMQKEMRLKKTQLAFSKEP